MLVTMILVSCGEAPATKPVSKTDEGGQPTQSTVSTLETAEPEEVPDIPTPEELNFDGQALKILVWKAAGRLTVNDNDDFYDEIDAENMEGEAVFEAGMLRQNSLEDKYGITVEVEVTSERVDTKYLNAYSAGLVEWDIISPVINYVPALIQSQSLMELSHLEYLDTSKTYWDQGLLEALAIDGKNYVLSGDISTMDEEMNICVAYNRTLGEEMGIDPFPYIEDNKWTMDVMYQLAKEVTKDLDGGGSFDLNDQYGIAHQYGSGTIMLQGSGELYAKLNADGVPEITINNSRVHSILEKLSEIYNDPQATGLVPGVYASWTELNNAMVAGKVAFRPANIYNLKEYLLMEDEFTVLPMPKFEEDQPGYHHLVLTNAAHGYCVPATTDRTEFISIMLEELAYMGRKYLTPAYYESYVSARLTADQKTAEMFDIIFATKTCDLGYIFDWGGMKSVLTQAMQYGGFSSKYDAVKDLAESAMEDSYNAIHEAIS